MVLVIRYLLESRARMVCSLRLNRYAITEAELTGSSQEKELGFLIFVLWRLQERFFMARKYLVVA